VKAEACYNTTEALRSEGRGLLDAVKSASGMQIDALKDATLAFKDGDVARPEVGIANGRDMPYGLGVICQCLSYSRHIFADPAQRFAEMPPP
jgi:hypothetical protein